MKLLKTLSIVALVTMTVFAPLAIYLVVLPLGVVPAMGAAFGQMILSCYVMNAFFRD